MRAKVSGEKDDINIMNETKLSPMTPTEISHGHRLPASLRGSDKIETPTAPEWAVPLGEIK